MGYQTLIGVTFGEPRIGKSVYEMLVMKDLVKWWGTSPVIPAGDVRKVIEWARSWGIKNPEVNFWRAFLTFKPATEKGDTHPSFIDLVRFLTGNDLRAPLGIWDDAGVWMFALDYQDPRVKAALKILQVAGTAFGGLKLTTPSIKMILKKVLEIEGIHVTKVIRTSGDRPLEREARTYRNSITPWGKRFLREVTADLYDVHLDQDDYDWYLPIREKYLQEALKLMAEAYGLKVRSTSELVAAQQEIRTRPRAGVG